jgi:hypothetical protein
MSVGELMNRSNFGAFDESLLKEKVAVHDLCLAACFAIAEIRMWSTAVLMSLGGAAKRPNLGVLVESLLSEYAAAHDLFFLPTRFANAADRICCTAPLTSNGVRAQPDVLRGAKEKTADHDRCLLARASAATFRMPSTAVLMSSHEWANRSNAGCLEASLLRENMAAQDPWCFARWAAATVRISCTAVPMLAPV